MSQSERDKHPGRDADAEVAQLSRKWTRLVHEQSRLDRQLELFERLHDFSRKTMGSFSLQGILQQVSSFATKELGHHRCVIFLDDRDDGYFTVRAHSGYASEAMRKRLAATQIRRDDDVPALLREHDLLMFDAADSIVELLDLSAALSLDRFLVAPLVSSTKKLIGMLVAGASAPQSAQYAPVSRDGLAGKGFRLLAEQASAALNSCILHWELAVERNLLEAKVRERTNELTQAYEQIHEDLEQARDFQQNILPSAISIDGLGIEATYRPVNMVGGDLYDIDELPDQRVMLFIADATGHGVRAALTTMFIKSEYDLAKQTASGPAQLLSDLNKSISGMYGRLEMRFTALCMELDLSQGRMRWSCAAHPAPCLVRAGRAEELSVGGTFMGIAPNAQFPEWEHDFQRGDALYLFTDGAFEVWNELGQCFDEERVHGFLTSAAASKGPVGEALYQELLKYSGKQELLDDYVLLGARFH